MAESGWTPQRLNDTLSRGEIYPLYLFFGDETFLIDETVASLEAAVLRDGLRDFNFNSFSGAEADAAQIRDAVETLPMMAPARIVVVRDVHELKEKEWELLYSLIDSPVSTTAFVCVANKIDKRKKHFKRFLDNGVVVEFKRPFDNQIPDWIRTLAKRHGVKMSPGGVEAFHQFVGSNLQDINAEMKKLRQYLGDANKVVSPEEIMRAVSRVRMESVFDLTDAIGQCDRARALDCLVNLLDHGQNEIGVLSLLARHVRILKLVNDGIKEGLSGAKLSSRAGVSPYFLKSYVDQARAWNDRKIDRTFRALLDTDRALKSSPVAAHIWLENFIVQTCAN